MTGECSQWSYGLLGVMECLQEEYSLVDDDKNFSTWNVFSWTMTDGVWEEYGLIMILCAQKECSVMVYDKMCPRKNIM